MEAHETISSQLIADLLLLNNQSINLGTGNITAANLNISNWDTAFGWGNHIFGGYQAQDAVLDDLSALAVVADNQFIVGSGAGVYVYENPATVLGTLSGQAAESFGWNGQNLTNIGNITSGDFGSGDVVMTLKCGNGNNINIKLQEATTTHGFTLNYDGGAVDDDEGIFKLIALNDIASPTTRDVWTIVRSDALKKFTIHDPLVAENNLIVGSLTQLSEQSVSIYAAANVNTALKFREANLGLGFNLNYNAGADFFELVRYHTGSIVSQVFQVNRSSDNIIFNGAINADAITVTNNITAANLAISNWNDAFNHIHNLTTDIDHDTLLNSESDEHYIQTAIVATGALDAGSITSNFQSIHIGTSAFNCGSITATGTAKVDGPMAVGTGGIPETAMFQVITTSFNFALDFINTRTPTAHGNAFLVGMSGIAQVITTWNVTDTIVGGNFNVGIFAFSGSPTINEVRSLQTAADINVFSGTLTKGSGLYVKNPSSMGVSTGTYNGIYLEEIAGAINNWQIYSEGGDSYHAGLFALGQVDKNEYIASNDDNFLDLGATTNIRFNQKVDFNIAMGNSAKDPTADAPADWVECEIQGTTYYLPAYAA